LVKLTKRLSFVKNTNTIMKKLLLTVFSIGSMLAVAQTQQVDLPITFDDANVNYDLQSFGNAAGALVVDPTDPNNSVFEQTQPVGPETWAGTTLGNSGLATPAPLAVGNLVMSFKIWSPKANTPVRLKIEDSNNPTIYVELDVTVTAANTWETLVYDFANSVVPFNAANTYDQVSVFCDFGNAAKNGEVYYIDDVMMGGGAPALSQIDLPITFDDLTVNYDLQSFGNASDAIITDPTDPSNSVLEQTQPVGPEVWAGTTIGNSGLATPAPLAVGNLIMSLRIWSPNANVAVRLKLENSNDPTIFVEVDATVMTAMGWETLVYDFGTSVVPFNPANTYDKVSVFCDFGNAAKNGEVYYIDDVMMGAGGPALNQIDLPITFEDAMTDYDLVSFGNASDTILVDPTDATNTVARQTQPVGPEVWAGTTFGDAGLANAVPFTMTDQIMSVRVWSPAAGIPVLLKVEDANDPTIFAEVQMMTTVANDWSVLNYDFSAAAPALNLSNTYDKVSVFCDFGNANKNGEVYFIDDIAFGPSTIGLTESKIANFAIAPNPSNGSFTITGNLGSRLNTTINVINLQGQLVYSNEVNTESLNERLELNLAKGVYLVQVQAKNMLEVQRIVIK
jgi:dihydroxyacetone kinase DhaKLM complex PTS-EIIA-like component DhaM